MGMPEVVGLHGSTRAGIDTGIPVPTVPGGGIKQPAPRER
jgi:hypothetical protein